MANVARPTEVKDGKKCASQLLTALLLHRPSPMKKGVAAQDLQEIYRVVDGPNNSAMGDYWLKLTRGKKVLGDDKLARVAHEAVLRGQITHHDYPLLQMSVGGMRLLQTIGNLLLESYAGGAVDARKVGQNLKAWDERHEETKFRRTEERKALRAQMRALTRKVTSALRSADELLGTLEQAEFFETPYRPGDAVPGTYDEAPYVSSVDQFVNLLVTLRASLADGLVAVTSTSVREKDLAGFADLPRIELQGSDVSASIESMHEKLLRMIAVDWDDDQSGEIVIEKVEDLTELLPPGPVVKLLWTRPTMDHAVPENLGKR